MKTNFEFIYRDKVRYSDCDMHQHLNHAKFFSFFEQARVEYLAALGFKMGSDFKSIPFILASAQCDYLSPANLNDELEIHLGVTHVGNKSLRIDFEMKNSENGRLLAKAQTVLVHFDYEKMESIPIPDALRKKISELKKSFKQIDK